MSEVFPGEHLPLVVCLNSVMPKNEDRLMDAMRRPRAEGCCPPPGWEGLGEDNFEVGFCRSKREGGEDRARLAAAASGLTVGLCRGCFWEPGAQVGMRSSAELQDLGRRGAVSQGGVGPSVSLQGPFRYWIRTGQGWSCGPERGRELKQLRAHSQKMSQEVSSTSGWLSHEELFPEKGKPVFVDRGGDRTSTPIPLPKCLLPFS